MKHLSIYVLKIPRKLLTAQSHNSGVLILAKCKFISLINLHQDKYQICYRRRYTNENIRKTTKFGISNLQTIQNTETATDIQKQTFDKKTSSESLLSENVVKVLKNEFKGVQFQLIFSCSFAYLLKNETLRRCSQLLQHSYRTPFFWNSFQWLILLLLFLVRNVAVTSFSLIIMCYNLISLLQNLSVLQPAS